MAAIVADDEIALARVGAPADDGTSPAADARDRAHEGQATPSPTCGSAAPAALVATTASGVLYHWDIGSGAAQLTDTTPGQPGAR